MKKKIIAFGGSGMTGSYLPKSIKNFDLVDGYDITDEDTVREIFYNERPDVVINLAAVTDVVGAETDHVHCYRVNSTGAALIADYCELYDARLIFISSVDVFDGEKKTPYTPADRKCPIVVYGKSKDAAEDRINFICRDALIIRAGWMFGGFEKDKKFVSYMMEQMLSGKKVIKAVNDIVGSPTYGKDLIEYIVSIAKTKFDGGTIHFCNSEPATRYEQALVIAQVMGYKGEVVPATMDEFKNFRALKNSVMLPSVKTRPWSDALIEYITLWKERIK